ncbi:MAG: ABC transporter permease, partial [Planctomycetaceae bacterium]
KLETALQQARNVLLVTHNGIEDFNFRTQENQVESINKQIQNARMSGGIIAGISLLVGGIGIMNIMLATLTERTREIGIRRALGARRRDIIEQFLTETVVLAGFGGLLGVILGLLTPFTFDLIRNFTVTFVLDGSTLSDTSKMFQEMQPKVAFWSLPLAFGISVGIGILFGLYPAQAAAKLDPIEALRHE